MNYKRLWQDEGYTGNSYNAALPFLNSGHEHQVIHVETGEQRTIHVRSNQSLDEAITNGEQWTEETVENEDELFRI